MEPSHQKRKKTMEPFSFFLAAMIREIAKPKRPFTQMAPSILVVENLPSYATKNDLESLFSRMGPLESVGFDSSNRGVVKFCKSNHAKEAMHQLNKTELKGKPISITWCEKQCPCSNAKLSLSIHDVANDDQLKDLFSVFGAVDFIKAVLQHPDTSYWTVQFDSEISATNAIKFFKSAEYHGMKLFKSAEYHGMKLLVSKYNDGKDLCVEYHPKDLDENDILPAFSMYGVCTVNIKKDKNCKLSGIGFVSYHTSKEAKEAMRKFNGAYKGSHRLYVRGIVTQAVTEDYNLEGGIVMQAVTEGVPIFVIEGNRRQFVTEVNMERFCTIPDFLQSLEKLGHDHGLLNRIGPDSPLPDSPWPGYEVVFKHVDNKKEEVIKLLEDVEPCFNEDPLENSELWFLGMVNKIEIYKKMPDLNA